MKRKLRTENTTYSFGNNKQTFRTLDKPEILAYWENGDPIFIPCQPFKGRDLDDWDSDLNSMLKWYNRHAYYHLSRTIVKIFRNELVLNGARVLIPKASKRNGIINGRKYVVGKLARRVGIDYVWGCFGLEDVSNEVRKQIGNEVSQLYAAYTWLIWEKSFRKLTYYHGRDEYKAVEPIARRYLERAGRDEIKIYRRFGLEY